MRRLLDSLGSALRGWFRRHGLNLYIGTFLALLLVALLAPKIFVEVPAGHVGVLWKRFGGGTVVESSYGEGLHMIAPWDMLVLYDARVKNQAWTYDTISSNGLAMSVEIAVRYHINKETVGVLHKIVGEDFQNVLISPEIGSAARELISRYTPEQLYAGERSFIQAQIMERMINNLSSSAAGQSVSGMLIVIEDVLIRGVTLPDSVKEAIERKTQQYHVMLEYDFRLQRELKEAKRKEIEAQGIEKFQEIVSRGITDDYLRLRGIEATNSLSQSPNSKIVLIGSGKDGLPIILGGMDDGTAAASTSKARNDAAKAAAPPAQAAPAPSAASDAGNKAPAPAADAPGKETAPPSKTGAAEPNNKPAAAPANKGGPAAAKPAASSDVGAASPAKNAP